MGIDGREVFCAPQQKWDVTKAIITSNCSVITFFGSLCLHRLPVWIHYNDNLNETFKPSYSVGQGCHQSMSDHTPLNSEQLFN